MPALKNVQPLSLVVYGIMLVLIVARLPDGLMGLFGRRRPAVREGPSRPLRSSASPPPGEARLGEGATPRRRPLT